jgi:DUF2075 family protein/DNA replication protein DnaC
MQLYAGSSKQFVDDAVQNRIAEKLKEAFFNYFRYNPPLSEVRSWQNSLSRMCMVIQYASLMEHGIILEYQLPLSSKRLDCMITGVNDVGKPNAVIIELKQWDEVSPSEIDDCVVTFIGRSLRDHLHPSRQVGNYQLHLENYHTAFHTGGVGLSSCSYLHNIQYNSQNELFNERFKSIIEEFPVFTGDQTSEMAEYLSKRVGKGDSQNVLAQVLQSKYKASKKLLDHTSQVIKREKAYILLDEQQVAFNAVLLQARKGFHDKKKVAILIKGGPGTGKSVIALNLVAELSAQGYNTQHATGSKAFTENVRKVVGNQAAIQFKYFASYQNVERDAIDVLILDETHRLRATGNTMYTPAAQRSDKPLIEHIIEAAKVSVFFIDDLQVVRPDEVGRSTLVRETAAKLGVKLYEYELEAQFRCNGSDAFINWVDNTLGIRKTANVLWDSKDAFDFRIMDNVYELETAIKKKQEADVSARLVAGFCWKWSKPDTTGHLINDVVVGDWSMPWNAKPDSTRLAANIPKSHYWASDPNGINQVGCIYTAQNFEFDYVGVIFGRDLRYDPKEGLWIGDRTQSHDAVVKRSKDKFLDLIKNTYRVLLTRGLRGCYVYFMDDDTRNFFKSRID